MGYLIALSIGGLVGVAGLCALAWLRARRGGLERAVWGTAAFVLAGLALARLLDAEDRARQTLRQLMRDEGLYDGRWDWQAPFAAGAVTLGGLGLIGLWLAWEKGLLARVPLAVLGALAGVLGLLGLIALRLISLHSVDRLLYDGALRLNWVLEAGLAGWVALCALRFIQRKGALPSRGMGA